MVKIEPKILKGFRDFLPQEQIARQKMIETVKASYERFGFEPLETPALEYADVLTGKYGDEGDKLMYRFKDNGDRDIALRYDLTIPLARVVAMNSDFKKPLKRYQISPVWRAENTQKGRFREFYQCDADIVGSTSESADAEVLALAATTLLGLGVSDFEIRVNSREIISAFYTGIGLTQDESSDAIRAVDKIDKIGAEGVRAELVKAKIKEDKVDKVLAFAQTQIKDTGDIIAQGRELGIPDEILGKLSRFISTALVLEPKARFIVDFSIARGLEYYTGLIFETRLNALPEFGSVLSGGRYDDLIGMFSNKSLPAVGLSVGLDRLYAALDELGLIKKESSTAQAYITIFDDSLALQSYRIAKELRQKGINTIVSFESRDLKKQLSYASDKGIKFVIICGPEEAKDGIVLIKDLKKGTQNKKKIDELPDIIRRG